MSSSGSMRSICAVPNRSSAYCEGMCPRNEIHERVFALVKDAAVALRIHCDAGRFDEVFFRGHPLPELAILDLDVHLDHFGYAQVTQSFGGGFHRIPGRVLTRRRAGPDDFDEVVNALFACRFFGRKDPVFSDGQMPV